MSDILESLRQANEAKVVDLGTSIHPVDLLKLRVDTLTDFVIRELAEETGVDAEKLENALEVLYETNVGEALDRTLAAIRQMQLLQANGEHGLVLP